MAERKTKKRKNGKTVNFLMGVDILQATDDYCAMTGINRTEVVEKALARYIAPYRTNDGRPPVEATYLTDVTSPDGKRVSAVKNCFILGDIERDGEDLYRIYSEGDLLEVPKDHVTIKENKEKEEK